MEKSKIARLQFIAHILPDYAHEKKIKEICSAGCKWIQLRIKNQSFSECVMYAERVKNIADTFGAFLIINDHIKVAKEVGAEGVHLGQQDESPAYAREVLGKNKIIGGTAHNLDELVFCVNHQVDYVGVGPFKDTKTKTNLSPFLGASGILKLVQYLKLESIDIPIIAVGGITLEDVPTIMEINVNGIAVSGAIQRAANTTDTVHQFLSRLNVENKVYSDLSN